jgi:hypothetical protein
MKVAPSSEFPRRASAGVSRLRSIFAAGSAAARKACSELGLNPEEERLTLEKIQEELEQRVPELLAAMSVIAMLPIVQERAYTHFLHKQAEARHTAEDLSQALVLKLHAAVTGALPRGNVGAWISVVRKNLYRDVLRKRRSEREGMKRIENAAMRLRRAQ